MATFIRPRSISHHIEKIIEEAASELLIISPYVKLDGVISNLLESQSRNVPIHVIYRKNKSQKADLAPEERLFFRSHRINTSFHENVHAKCFLNEKEALLTSMNLVKYSLDNNLEMGILVSKRADGKLYADLYQQAMIMKDTSSGFTVGRRKKETSTATRPKSPGRKSASKVPKSGFCIRCKAGLSANPEKPYCRDCYETWSRFENPEYEEKTATLAERSTRQLYLNLCAPPATRNTKATSSL